EIPELVGLVVERSVDLVAESVSQRQVLADAPFILRVAAIVVSVRLSVRAVLRLVGIGDKTEQKVGEAVDVSVLFAGNGREIAGEEIVAVLVARQEGDVVLVTAPDVLESGFETVRALQPREVVSDLEREILLYARMSELIGGAAEEIADVEHG